MLINIFNSSALVLVEKALENKINNEDGSRWVGMANTRASREHISMSLQSELDMIWRGSPNFDQSLVPLISLDFSNTILSVSVSWGCSYEHC